MVGSSGDPTDLDSRLRPPILLLAAAAVAVVGGAVLLPTSSFVGHVTGYVLSSFVTIGLLATFTRIDVSRHHDPRYRPALRMRRAAPLLAAAGVAVAAMHVWSIATELAG